MLWVPCNGFCWIRFGRQFEDGSEHDISDSHKINLRLKLIRVGTMRTLHHEDEDISRSRAFQLALLCLYCALR